MNKITHIYDLLCISQQDLLDYLCTTLPLHTSTKDYLLYRKNNEPKPLLCVHLDTINTSSGVDGILKKTDIVIDDKQTLSLSDTANARCLGADDRAGVWIALRVIEYMERTGDYKYDVGFFCDEEIGGVGSDAYRKDFPIDNNTCYIGLDRRCTPNVPEVALYGFDNDDLISLFEGEGYKVVNGSFTDASNIAGDKACVNLSVGYNSEHTKRETLHLPSMIYTLEVLCHLDPITDVYFSDGEDDYRYYESYQDKDWEIEALEEENKAMRSYLQDLGIDPEQVIFDYYYE